MHFSSILKYNTTYKNFSTTHQRAHKIVQNFSTTLYVKLVPHRFRLHALWSKRLCEQKQNPENPVFSMACGLLAYLFKTKVPHVAVFLNHMIKTLYALFRALFLCNNKPSALFQFDERKNPSVSAQKPQQLRSFVFTKKLHKNL